MIESQLLVIGDVHGCFRTFSTLIQQHFQPANEILIQVGDLLDRGKYVPETVALARLVQSRYPERAYFLKGNHEYEAVTHFHTQSNVRWFEQAGRNTLRQYMARRRSFGEDVQWFENLPLYWESNVVFISHAGVSETSDPYNPANPEGVLWNRNPLERLPIIQIHGHTPVAEVTYQEISNAWNIDTGCYKGGGLSALRIASNGKIIDKIHIPTNHDDMQIPFVNK